MNEEQRELRRRVEQYAIDDSRSEFSFSSRLARDHQWTAAYSQRVIREYQRFAFLAVAAGHPVTPSEQVDQVWHLHMIYTESYWKDFCGAVLRRPLHHHPTKGGASECRKFADWYERTLASYRKFFNEEPPGDIWPDANKRFGEDIQSVHVNVHRNWIIPKPRWVVWVTGWTPLSSVCRWKRVAFAAAVALLAVVLTGCGSWKSPFDFKGPEFLRFFVTLWLVNLAIAAWLRWHLRLPNQNVPHTPDLDPYEIACLAGKEDRAAEAAIVNLLDAKILELHETQRRLLRPENSGDAMSEPSVKLTPIEAAAYQGVDPLLGGSVTDVRKKTIEVAEPMIRRLQEQGLVMSGLQSARAWLIPLAIALIVPLIGLIKIAVGLFRDRPVEFLILLTAVAVVVAFAGFWRKPHRSRRGDHVLGRLKETHARLKQSGLGLASQSGALPLAVGLFGLGVLTDTALGSLVPRLKEPASSGSSDGGSCGGGCGGGGCGGCGGCGG